MNNRFVSAVLALSIAASFTGCGNTQNSSDTASSSVSSSQNEQSNAEMTVDELLGMITFCGKPLKYPLTVSSLGEGFSLDTLIEESQDGAMVHLCYNNSPVCILSYDCAPGEVNNDTPISMLNFVPDDPQRSLLSVNGFTAEDKLSDAETKIGKGEMPNDNTIIYNTKEGCYLEILEIAGDIYSISLVMKKS